MLSFFTLAAQSPGRQNLFRRAVIAHLVAVAGAVWLLFRHEPGRAEPRAGHFLLLTGILEGASLVGWRLVQLPRSQALEFLLVSPLRPFWVFTGEALVGLVQLGLVTLSSLPVLLLLILDGRLQPLDPVLLLLMPWMWGAVTGLGLTAWAYAPLGLRRWGERVAAGLIVLYLLVGVLAGEHLRDWLAFLPPAWSDACVRGFALAHTHNPFGVAQFWLEDGAPAAWERAALLLGLALPLLAGLFAGCAGRLHAHFQELHYRPQRDPVGVARPVVGERPLSWWAVKRVSKFSGRINLWLAGGFCVLYAAYLVAGPAWPSWLGRMVFQMCDNGPGVAGLATGLVLLAAVPAAFQYGLWDSSVQDRCRRLELLLLTELGPRDYWHAAALAAWRRGRGYLLIALLLWGAAVLAGRIEPRQVGVVVACSVLLWALYFALGFRAFARGMQAGGLGLLLTVGLPLVVWLAGRAGVPFLADLLPPGMVCSAAAPARSPWWLVGPTACAALTLLAARHSLRHCDSQLRRWYDAHAGHKLMT